MIIELSLDEAEDLRALLEQDIDSCVAGSCSKLQLFYERLCDLVGKAPERIECCVISSVVGYPEDRCKLVFDENVKDKVLVLVFDQFGTSLEETHLLKDVTEVTKSDKVITIKQRLVDEDNVGVIVTHKFAKVT